jgi:hypothetical protein
MIKAIFSTEYEHKKKYVLIVFFISFYVLALATNITKLEIKKFDNAAEIENHLRYSLDIIRNVSHADKSIPYL